MFTSDCFGAPLTSAELAESPDVDTASADELRGGQLLWATVDSPWVHQVDPVRYRDTLDPLRAMQPSALLSTHLPPAVGRTEQFLDLLAEAPQADPFIGPDQRALEELLATFEPDPTVPVPGS